jgi:amino acid transporter
MPIVGIIIIIGTIGGVNNWVIAPTTGLSIAARDGNLPAHFGKTNKNNAPHTLLIYQACLVTLLMLVFLYMPSVSSSYWLLTALAAQLYMGMYLLMFASALYLRFKHPAQHRPFRIPGGKNIGMFIIAGCGMAGALIAIGIGFVPPEHMQIGSVFHYETALICGLLFAVLPPIIIYRYHNRRTLLQELRVETPES